MFCITKNDVGMSVYDLRFGNGEIEYVYDETCDIYFEGFGMKAFNNDGSTEGRMPRTLYWSKPEIIEQGKPKIRKVKRQITLYATVFKDGSIRTFYSEDEASRLATKRPVVKITGSYETEIEVNE